MKGANTKNGTRKQKAFLPPNDTATLEKETEEMEKKLSLIHEQVAIAMASSLVGLSTEFLFFLWRLEQDGADATCIRWNEAEGRERRYVNNIGQ